MNNDAKIDVLKEHVRNERFKKEPIANALISILIKKGLISEADRRQILREFDEYIDNQVEYYFNDLKQQYNPDEQEN